MGRGISNGGGQSSLGYLFGSGEVAPNPNPNPSPNPNTNKTEALQNQKEVTKHGPSQDSGPAVPRAEVGKQIPAGVPGNMVNNYYRADGQNRGNFLTERPSTKVHAAPGGGSSLDYLFGGGEK